MKLVDIKNPSSVILMIGRELKCVSLETTPESSFIRGNIKIYSHLLVNHFGVNHNGAWIMADDHRIPLVMKNGILHVDDSYIPNQAYINKVKTAIKNNILKHQIQVDVLNQEIADLQNKLDKLGG